MTSAPTPDARPSPTRRQAVAVLAGAFVWPGTGLCAADALRASRPLFGSTADVAIRPVPGGAAAAASAMARLMAGLERLNREWNAWKPGQLGRLNQALREGRDSIVAPDLLALIRLSRRLEQRSGGLFNVGIGGLVGAWGFHDDVLRPGARPDDMQLAPWRHPVPSLSSLRVAGRHVSASDPRLQLDLGAIGKGWAIDRALDRLAQQGLHDAVVNLGGNLAAQGNAGGRPWQIGIRDPLGDGVMARVATRGREAVVTSGSYERFRLVDGQRLSHIVDPRRSAPAEGLLSVTVLHPSAALADAAATALMVAGPGHWSRVARRMGVREVLVVHADGRGAMTAALAPRLRFDDARWAARLGVVA
jgi:FAD:protein FMN transferase